MAIVQFRIHPGVGCARFGNSSIAYHLASEFPYFLQEEFPNLRFRPKPRRHPKSFFPLSPAGDALADATGTDATYPTIYEDPAFNDKCKEGPDKAIFPQGVRFRVFAYVFDDDVSRRMPLSVFEVTASMADITWTVDIANKKAHVGGAPDEIVGTAQLVASNAVVPVPLLCKRVRRDHTRPNLAYVFLERDDADRQRVTGRLHVIGNEGGLQGAAAPTSLWSDDWYDSAGDGPVQATIAPKSGDALRIAAGVSNIADLQYFSYNTDAPQPGTTASITAMPAWVVIGPPDYVPDMGHFVSLYDIAVDRGFSSLESSSVVNQPGKHKLIRWKSQFDSYRKTDYLIHIHPQMCLFEDVKFVSGEAIGEPERNGPSPEPDRFHNPTIVTPPPAPDPEPRKTEKAAIAHGGIKFKARDIKDRLKKPTDLKDPDPSKPILEWMKRAVFARLRKPHTLYPSSRTRRFLIRPPGGGETHDEGTFPRKLGRRMDYGLGSGDDGLRFDFPSNPPHHGNLRMYHGLPHSGNMCGFSDPVPTDPPPGKTFTGPEVALLPFMDDMYWPATFSDMPMLRELAYTPLQYNQFEAWQAADADIRMDNIFDLMLSPGLITSFTVAGATDADQHFADFLAARSLYAPAVIDMAAMGAMLGGSFLPGIEVGREAGMAANWCLFYGATKYFPTVRFKPVGRGDEHAHGTLTKDLAVPWSQDFKACDEKFWPTSRPGRTIRISGGPRKNWQISLADPLPHLTPPGPAANALDFVQKYWIALGFVRRQAGDEFIELEQAWHSG